MIRGFKDPNAEAIFEGDKPGKGFPSNLIRVARRKLIMLNAAQALDDLRNPPGNHLLAPVHPGEILREEFLAPLGMTPYALASACRVPRTRFERLAAERARVSPDTALRLGRYFGTTPGFWLAIQAHYDIETARRMTGTDIEAIQPRAAAT